MIIGAIDFETTTNVINDARITEIGALLFDENWQEKAEFSCLVYADDYPPQSEEVLRITGLTDEVLKSDGIHPREALTQLVAFVEKADFFIAHNKEFDRSIFDKEMTRFLPEVTRAKKSRWLCSLNDIQYASHFRCKKLSHLALDHGITVKPETLHRAIGDLRLMGELMRHGGYQAADIVAFAQEPWVTIKAEVSFGNNQLAKDRAYRWQDVGGKTFIKSWVKRVKKNQLQKEIMESPFRVLVLEEESDA